MLFISFFGSGGFTAVLVYILYIQIKNRVTAIAFVTYMTIVLYTNSLTKNIYH